MDALKTLQTKREALVARSTQLEAVRKQHLVGAQQCAEALANIDGALQVVDELVKELTPAPAEAPKPDGQS